MLTATICTNDATPIRADRVPQALPDGGDFASLKVGQVALLIFDSEVATQLVHAALDAVVICRAREAKADIEGKHNDQGNC